MNYLQNHCWIHDSNWGGMYDCRHLVNMNSYDDDYAEDWKAVVETVYGINSLKKEVVEWLEENVKDAPKPYSDNTTTKAWAVGSPDYNSWSASFVIGFQRRRDAMAFIKRWSKWQKPIRYCQYFTDVRKTLDTVTGKYKSEY